VSGKTQLQQRSRVDGWTVIEKRGGTSAVHLVWTTWPSGTELVVLRSYRSFERLLRRLAERRQVPRRAQLPTSRADGSDAVEAARQPDLLRQRQADLNECLAALEASPESAQHPLFREFLGLEPSPFSQHSAPLRQAFRMGLERSAMELGAWRRLPLQGEAEALRALVLDELLSSGARAGLEFEPAEWKAARAQVRAAVRERTAALAAGAAECARALEEAQRTAALSTALPALENAIRSATSASLRPGLDSALA
jgi:hypothetical protein